MEDIKNKLKNIFNISHGNKFPGSIPHTFEPRHMKKIYYSEKYYYTKKYDGIRNILILFNNNAYIWEKNEDLNISIKKFSGDIQFKTYSQNKIYKDILIILDGELIDNNFYIFNILYFNNNNILINFYLNNIPFIHRILFINNLTKNIKYSDKFFNTLTNKQFILNNYKLHLESITKTYWSKSKTIKSNYNKVHRLIKSKLYNKYTKLNGNLLELCSGQGGDISNWNSQKYVLGIEVDSNAINQAKQRFENKKYEFINADLNHYIYDNHNAGIELSDINKLKVIKKNTFNTVSLQFCIHYFIQNPKIFQNLLSSISDSLAIDGYLIGTSFDKQKIDLALSNKKSIPDDIKSWYIKKLTSGNIEVFIRSIGIPHIENLLDYKYLHSMLIRAGLDLVEIKSFDSYPEYNQLNYNEKQLSKLYNTFVYIKKRPNTLDKFKLHNDIRLTNQDICIINKLKTKLKQNYPDNTNLIKLYIKKKLKDYTHNFFQKLLELSDKYDQNLNKNKIKDIYIDHLVFSESKHLNLKTNIYIKPYYKLNNLRQYQNIDKINKYIHVDGIIIINKLSNYITSPVKWKPKNQLTIDFRVSKFIKMKNKYFLTIDTKNKKINNYKNFTILKNQKLIVNKIYEFKINNINKNNSTYFCQWDLIRSRPDKIKSNSDKTFYTIIDNLINYHLISLETIKNQLDQKKNKKQIIQDFCNKKIKFADLNIHDQKLILSFKYSLCKSLDNSKKKIQSIYGNQNFLASTQPYNKLLFLGKINGRNKLIQKHNLFPDYNQKAILKSKFLFNNIKNILKNQTRNIDTIYYYDDNDIIRNKIKQDISSYSDKIKNLPNIIIPELSKLKLGKYTSKQTSKGIKYQIIYQESKLLLQQDLQQIRPNSLVIFDFNETLVRSEFSKNRIGFNKTQLIHRYINVYTQTNSISKPKLINRNNILKTLINLEQNNNCILSILSFQQSHIIKEFLDRIEWYDDIQIL